MVQAVRRNTAPGVPVLAKLSPDVTDIVAIARPCVDAGADGLSMINTLLGMVIDTDTMRPVLAGVTGGLSGPAIRPVAVRCVWQVHAALPDVPIIGMGGIRTGLDALEFVLAGRERGAASARSIFHDPRAPARITRRAARPRWPSAGSRGCRTPSATRTDRMAGGRPVARPGDARAPRELEPRERP